MNWWLLFTFLLCLLSSTHEQVANSTLTKSSSQDHWPKGAKYPSVGTSQPNGSSREHLKVVTSYKIGIWDKTTTTTDSQTLQPFSHSDEDRNEEFTCSQVWFYPKKTTNGSVICECGSVLSGRVRCTNETHDQLQVLDCYCMTYSVYSYSLACVECSNYTMNWIKYIAVAFLPLTLFLGVIVIFRLSVISDQLNGFVLVAQIYSVPAQLRYLTLSAHAHFSQDTIVVGGKILSLLYGCWNLDFFRMIYPAFCLHPKMTTIQALALDYVLAIYPLALLGVVFVFVELHDRGCRLTLCLWKPFHHFFSHFRRQWDIRTSLVDAFATLLLLSYMYKTAQCIN